MIKSRVGLVLGSVFLLGSVAAGCSSDAKSSAGTNAPAAATAAALTIQNSAFSAASVTAGTEFTISNKDSRTHTVTDDAGSFDVRVSATGTEKLTIPKAGTYKIHCTIHSSMHGTITVG